MSRIAAVLVAAGAVVLVTGCAGSGQPHQTAAPSTPGAHASLVAKGTARVCDQLRPVAAQVAALKRPGFGELEHYSSVLAGLGRQVYQNPGGNAVLATQLNQAATAMGQMAVSDQAKYLKLAQTEVRQLIRLCPAARRDPDPGRD